jgi:hypothetical protein
MKRPTSSPEDAEHMALLALGWILSEERRAHRFLDLTGLTPDTLRASAGNRATLRAVTEFLESHEPDLLAAADALQIPPETLASVGALLHHSN